MWSATASPELAANPSSSICTYISGLGYRSWARLYCLLKINPPQLSLFSKQENKMATNRSLNITTG